MFWNGAPSRILEVWPRTRPASSTAPSLLVRPPGPLTQIRLSRGSCPTRSSRPEPVPTLPRVSVSGGALRLEPAPWRPPLAALPSGRAGSGARISAARAPRPAPLPHPCLHAPRLGVAREPPMTWDGGRWGCSTARLPRVGPRRDPGDSPARGPGGGCGRGGRGASCTAGRGPDRPGKIREDRNCRSAAPRPCTQRRPSGVKSTRLWRHTGVTRSARTRRPRCHEAAQTDTESR